ncbi:MAG TPA: hypothetical protein VMR18_01745 [Candidatus Saccharimonadales bacterium]|jgi:hypothetical protein|nr:hypothetical protein [Candidatus Saccharimonadales bacterium]
MSSLPNPGSNANNWGSILNDFLQQALAADGTLVTSATNSYTSAANTNLASGSKPGLVQLAGDLTGTYDSPALASVITAGSVGSSSAIPVLTYDAKGRITAVSTATPSGGGGGSSDFDGGNASSTYAAAMTIDGGDST